MKSFEKQVGGEFWALLLSGALTVLSSCGDDKNYYDPEYAVKQYNASWEKTMGAIDPNQTWNMASAKTLKVTAPESGIVSVYSKGLDESFVLAKASVTSGTNTLKFDVPAGMTEVYAVLTTENGRASQAVSVAGDEAAVSFKAGKAVRAKVEKLTPQQRRKIGYVNGVYSDYSDKGFDIKENYYSNQNWGAFYATNEWPVFVNGSIWNWNDANAEVDYEWINLESIYPDVVEAVKKVTGSEYTKDLEEFSQNISYTTVEKGEIALTYVGGSTKSASTIGYFYTNPSATEEEMKAAPKYVLIPRTDKMSMGNTYKLVYYGESGESEPSFEFPKGVKIHFFLSRGFERSIDNYSWMLSGRINFSSNNEKYDVYCLNASLQFYSDYQLNLTACSNTGWNQIASTAAFSTHGVNCISFEDWPNSGTDTDWNDVAFTVNAPFGDFKTIDKNQSWTLAFEDLGATDDFDFNDVVLRITKNDKEENGTVSSSIDVDLCAAGGTLPATVYFGSKILGEVHKKFEVEEGTMVNTGGTSKSVVSLLAREMVDQNFTISDNARQFKIVVSGDETAEITLPAEKGTAPQAICIPGKWAWPTERTRISTAYKGFGEWGANYRTSQDWYKTPASTDMVVNK